MILFPNNLGRELAEKLAFSLEKNQHLTKAKDAEMSASPILLSQRRLASSYMDETRSREKGSGRHESLSYPKETKFKLGKALVEKFKDGEIRIKIEEKLEGEDVFVLGCLKPPTDNLLEFVLLADAVKRLKPKSLTFVITYFPYARQDRYFEGEPLSAEVLANIINSLKANKVITVDIHSKRVEQMINNSENLSTVETLAKYFQGKDITVIAPDKGAIERAKHFAGAIGAEVAYLDKSRPQPNLAEILDIHGKVKENVVILDDMIDTGGTIIKSAEFLESRGAKNIYVAVTHGLFSGGLERFENSKINEVLVTDTLPQNNKSEKLKVISVAELIAETIESLQ